MKKVIYILALLPFITLSIVAQNIPPKSSLGVYLAQAPAETKALYAIQNIIPNSTAEKIKLQTGDVLLAINGKEIKEANVLFGTLKAMKVGDAIRLDILRAGKKMTKKGKMQAVIPLPHKESAEIILSEVPFRKGYMRSIINKPKGNGPFKTIYFLQGYPCQSVNWKNPNLTFQRLINHWVDLGYVVFRVEKPGIGEYINCEDCLKMTFDDELEGFENGYQEMMKLPYVDKDNIIFYGHSLGGNVAPYLASKYQPKGVAVFGTVVKPWDEYLVAMTRNQQPLLGEDYAENEEELKIAKKLIYQIFTENKNPKDLELNNQETHILQNTLGFDNNGLMVNRSVEFWKSLNAHNFTKYWKNINSKVLAMYGKSDVQALSTTDAERIAEIVNHYHPNQGTFKLIPNTDHGLGKIKDKQEWLALQQSGQYGARLQQGVSPKFLEVLDAWLASLSDEKPSNQDPELPDSQYEYAKYNLPAFITDVATMDVKVADLDNDKDLDLVLAMEAEKNVILYNDGKGKFTEHQILEPKYKHSNPKIKGEDSEDVALADFDNDGDVDLLFVSEDTKNHELVWNEGNGKFKNADFEFPKKLQANALATLDLNQDGFMDVIIGNRGQNEVFINLKNGTFEEQTEKYFPKNEDHTQDLQVVDIDNDGDLDLIEGNEAGGSNVYVFEKGRFVEVENALGDIANHETRKVVVKDLNNDGLQDIFLCNVAWNAQRNPKNLLFLNQGKGKFKNISETFVEETPATTLDAVFIDLNEDTKLDVITGNGWGSSPLKVFIKENGKFKQKNGIMPQIKEVPTTVLIAEDLNNDGKKDFYLGNYRETDMLILSK